MPVKYGLTHLSALSVGIDPARSDLAPRERANGAYFSVGSQAEFLVSKNALSLGTRGTAFKHLVSSVVSVTLGQATASRFTTATVTLTGAEVNDHVTANPASIWSGDYYALSYTAQVTAADTVSITASNNSGNNITPDAMNWRVTAIAF